MFRKPKLAVAIVAALTIGAVPLAAQNFSQGYKFIKAVKERDGTTVEGALAGAGARIVNSKDGDNGDTALHIVTRDRDLTWLRFLLAKQARPEMTNNAGETPLILATQLGWVEGATALLRAGANVNTTSNRGETPIILAVLKRDVPMIRFLLANGADPKKADRAAGYSAMDYAKRDDRSGMILRLLETEQKAVKPPAGPPR